MFNDILFYDSQIVIFINSLGSSAFDGFWLFVTKPLHWLWLPFITTYYLIQSYAKKEAFKIMLIGFLSCCITLVLVELIKRNVARFRPINNDEIRQFLRVIIEDDNYSYVSGHSAFSMTYAVFTYKFLKNKTRFSIIVFVFPLLFAYSRLYLGVHFLTDVLSGFFLGFIVSVITVKLLGRKTLFHSTYGKSITNR